LQLQLEFKALSAKAAGPEWPRRCFFAWPKDAATRRKASPAVESAGLWLHRNVLGNVPDRVLC